MGLKLPAVRQNQAGKFKTPVLRVVVDYGGILPVIPMKSSGYDTIAKPFFCWCGTYSFGKDHLKTHKSITASDRSHAKGASPVTKDLQTKNLIVTL